ncbi:MAG: hypothetical protein HKO65_00135 [Gemmatimonadetes bacterium]|nr:1-acyl-sn-glycerol-3-phosphate acyltransferase [Gemmatimonadota bacterium]NNM03480.1 hypothetical protein [Gemmatimonadota bacterium]
MVLRWVLRAWIRMALWFRFRKIQWVFHGPIPMAEGAIIAGNHQNSILDSMTLASSSPRIPFTLSRGSLFDTALARAFLSTIRMIPVYRFRDGFGKMRKNSEVFRQFVEVLRRDEWLLIFPEGNHELRYTLRRLQKGIARIVFAAQEDQGWEKEIPILPVGLQYEDHTGIGGRLLVQFGHPVSSLAFRDLYAENPKEAERGLTQSVFEALKPLLIIPPSDEAGYRAAMERWAPNKGRFPDLMDQFRSDRDFVAGGGRDEAEAGSGVLVSGGGRTTKALRRLAGFCLSLPGIILHAPPTLAAVGLVRVFVRDVPLIPGARFLVAMFLVPIWYLMVLFIWLGRTESLFWSLLPLLLMPLSLWFWSRFRHWVR